MAERLGEGHRGEPQRLEGGGCDMGGEVVGAMGTGERREEGHGVLGTSCYSHEGDTVVQEVVGLETKDGGGLECQGRNVSFISQAAGLRRIKRSRIENFGEINVVLD